jgi:hypothetical protein
MDILLAGRAMGWRNNAYDVRIRLIDEKITPQNRIIMCRKVDANGTLDRSNDVAHKKLEQAYRKAHRVRRPRSDVTREKLCVKSIMLGMAIGVMLCVSLGRHR